MTAHATMTNRLWVRMVEEHDDLRDPRPGRPPRPPILLLAILGVISGADTGVKMARLGQRKQHWLATFRDLSPGMLSHDPCS